MQGSTFFRNFLSSREITPTRLRNAAESTENRLTADNAGGDWTPVLAPLSSAVAALSTELGDVDTAFNIRLGRTMTVDQVIAGFKKYVSNREPFVAEALGGRDTPAYLEFYPAGISEYSKATKTNIETMLARVREASSTHTALLGPTLTAGLGGWEGTYEAARDAQEAQKGNLGDNRAERTAACKAVEVAYLAVLFFIGYKFPGNIEKCAQYADLSLLYPAGAAADDAGDDDTDDTDPQP